MNKPLHYAFIGGLVLFIGLCIPFQFVGDRDGSTSFTKATDFSFTNQSNPSAAFSSSFHPMASYSYSSPSSLNVHTTSTMWSQPAQSAMTMPLSFNTTKWTPSAPKMFVEQDFGGTFVTSNAQSTSARTALAIAQPVVRRNNSSSTNAPVIAQAASKVPAMQAPRYTAHQSMVQQPFSNALPSESNTTFAGDTPDGISNRKNGFVTPADPEQSTESPVGEAWSLLFMAFAAALVIFIRKKKLSKA